MWKPEHRATADRRGLRYERDLTEAEWALVAPLIRPARRSFPFTERIIGDAGYQGQKMQAAVARTGSWELQIVRRCDRHRFVVLPKRWIVERTLAWISRCRRLARDYERHARKAAAFVRLAMIRLMLRRLA